jgi:hypothetical protein
MPKDHIEMIADLKVRNAELRRTLAASERLADSYFKQMAALKHERDALLERLEAAGVEIPGCGDAVCDLCYPRLAECTR